MTGSRIGVVGLGQGRHLARWATRTGLDVVAGCDLDPARLDAAEEIPSRSPDWRDLLGLDLDGVILAGDFDTHAPLAVEFLDRGVHVLSETAACTSEQEGKRLIAAADSSPASYSFAENYVCLPHVRLIRELVGRGEIGRVELIEADYLHGLSPEAITGLLGPADHWRNRISATAYCTHTLSPILATTGAYPVQVAAHAVVDSARPTAVVMVVRLSTGALAVARHGFLQGEPDSHWSWLSVRGDRGLVENVRGRGDDAWSVRVRMEPWAAPAGQVREEVVVPEPMPLGGEPVERAAEGTVAVLAAFRDTIEHGAEPLVPVRAAVAASLVGVVGAESLRRGGEPVPVPSVD
ncbi:Gfo/Idh/MocA family protein [Pseudonocardia acaciae]|uniref:Gfo/Idh/MocA family protein n=1 Tax=Pseudonocardia acaciae TaxID=551276 RepID=UPI000687C8AD|nr:Gfo/Idh/MocA family oxidoreductase [Pseudonocardia acaciae]